MPHQAAVSTPSPSTLASAYDVAADYLDEAASLNDAIASAVSESFGSRGSVEAGFAWIAARQALHAPVDGASHVDHPEAEELARALLLRFEIEASAVAAATAVLAAMRSIITAGGGGGDIAETLGLALSVATADRVEALVRPTLPLPPVTLEMISGAFSDVEAWFVEPRHGDVELVAETRAALSNAAATPLQHAVALGNWSRHATPRHATSSWSLADRQAAMSGASEWPATATVRWVRANAPEGWAEWVLAAALSEADDVLEEARLTADRVDDYMRGSAVVGGRDRIETDLIALALRREKLESVDVVIAALSPTLCANGRCLNDVLVQIDAYAETQILCAMPSLRGIDSDESPLYLAACGDPLAWWGLNGLGGERERELSPRGLAGSEGRVLKGTRLSTFCPL